MAFIKVESEDMAIEEAFTVKREDAEEHTEKMFIKEEQEEVTIEEDFRVKREDTEEHTEITFFKEESREATTEADFIVKHEVTEEHTEMPFIKQERDEATNEEDFRVKHEDTEEQTVLEGNTFEHFLCGRIAAGEIQPYMFEPESDPENQDDEPSTPQIPRAVQPVTAWCSCKNCAVMPTEKENICCLEIPQVKSMTNAERQEAFRERHKNYEHFKEREKKERGKSQEKNSAN